MPQSHQKIGQRFRSAMAPHVRRLNLGGPYRGNVDTLVSDELLGWVVRLPAQTGGLSVGLFARDGLLATATASQMRDDVREAGVGDGRSGFAFRVDATVRQAIRDSGGSVEVRVLEGGKQHVLGHWTLPGATGTGGSAAQTADTTAEPQAERARQLLYLDLVTWRDLLAHTTAAGGFTQDTPSQAPALTRHDLLFADPGHWPADAHPGAIAIDGHQPAYLDYSKFRMRKEREFDTDVSAEDREHLLAWYADTYATVRNGLRVPLTATQVAHLNEPLIMGGQRHAYTRLMWWKILSRPGMLADRMADAAPNGDVARTLYWWAWNEARSIHAEDFAVTDRHAALLSSVSVGRKDDRWPFSPFMDYLHAENPLYHFLSPVVAEDRRVMTLILMLHAATRPDVLRYLPRTSIDRALDTRDGPSILARFLAALTMAAKPEPLDRARYGAALHLQGFDLDRMAFRTFTPAGHRLHSAALPAPMGERVDVQVIGPLEKASGLGQATRLSGDILDKTGLSVNRVNFGLDNPAPEGFSTAAVAATYRPARINLIHLNAESVPLAFAYEPDAFSGAYNIGYFYWELNTPATCHYLSLDLLDEIWVSTDYGVDIYEPDFGGPVTNVGMAYESLPDIDRATARAALDRRLHLKGDEFVVIMVFDSYSFAQRKNPFGVVEAFLRAFDGVPQARLVIKTQNRSNVFDPVQDRIWKRIDAAVRHDPRIVVINETLSYHALLELKAASDAYVSLHRSEGWGFGMIEAMNLGVPVICTGYSGNMDFCSQDTAWLVDYVLTPLGPDDYIFVRKGQVWAEPDLDHAAAQMRACWADPEARATRAAAARENVQSNFSVDAIAARYGDRLRDDPGDAGRARRHPVTRWKTAAPGRRHMQRGRKRI